MPQRVRRDATEAKCEAGVTGEGAGMNEAPEGTGTLNWMVTYQSAHGGIGIRYLMTELDAVDEVTYLASIGRTPVLWRRWT